MRKSTCSGVPDLFFQYFSAAPAPLRVDLPLVGLFDHLAEAAERQVSNQPPTPAMSKPKTSTGSAGLPSSSAG